jgi:protein SCO1/2
MAGCLPAAGARAQALQLPPPPAVRFAPPPHARLPLDAEVRDDSGAPVPLGRWFGSSPVVLVPGYYRCRNLCGTLFEGVLQALAWSGLPGGSYRLLGVSIDPDEDARAAAARRHAYAGLLPAGASLTLLTADAGALARIEGALGYHAVPDRDGGEIAHAAGFVVAAPDGRIARYFPGVRFDPAALGQAVRAASGVAKPPSSWLPDRLLLLCSHYDPASGRNTPLAMAAVRAVALMVLAALVAWAWRRRRKAGDAP